MSDEFLLHREGCESELLEAYQIIEGLLIQHCDGSGTNEHPFDSAALSANARAMRFLAKAGRMTIDYEAGRHISCRFTAIANLEDKDG